MAHVLILPDGMRRYSEQRSVSLDHAYALGGTKLQRAAQWLFFEHGFQEVTFHCFALYNHQRPLQELAPLVHNGIETLITLIDSEWMRRHSIALRVVGALDQLSERFPDLQKIVHFSQQRHYRHDGRTLNILAAYAGSWDFDQAIRSCETAGKTATFQNVTRFLQFQRPVDVVIRSGQAFRQVRLSDSLWPVDQAQMFGLPTFWPAVRKSQLVRIVDHWQTLEGNRLHV